jgi:hypothetical protein
MTLRLEITPPDGPVSRLILEPGSTRHVASPAEQYRLVGDTGEIPPSVSVRRVNNSLVVAGLSEDRELEIRNFFGACSPGRDCALSIDVTGAAPIVVTNETPPLAALSDGSFLLLGTSGDMLSAMAVAPPLPEGGLSAGTITAGLAGLIGLGLAASVGGGGGGGGTPTGILPTALLPTNLNAPAGGAGTGTAPASASASAPEPAPALALALTLAPSEPRVTITDDGPGTASRPVTFTFRMSEPVTDFNAEDVIVIGGVAGNLEALPDGLGYRLTVTPDADVASGTISIEVPEGAITGASGTPSTVATRATQRFDTLPPTLTITDNIAGVATGPVTFTFSLSEPVSDFTAEDVSVTGGSRGALTALPGDLDFTMTVVPTAGVQNGTIAIELLAGAFTDAAGNALAIDGRTTQAFDTARPTVTVTDDAATVVNRPVAFRFVFSEPVTGFAADDVTVTGGTRGALIADRDGSGFTMTVAPATGVAVGEIGVSVRAGAVTDTAGNTNPASLRQVQAFDVQPPTQRLASFSVADDQPPRLGNLVSGETTNDTRPRVTLTLDSLLGTGEVLALRRDGATVASADRGQSISFVDGPLPGGGSRYVYTASISDAAGNVSTLDLNGPAAGQGFTFSVV